MNNIRLHQAFEAVKDLSPGDRAKVATLIKLGLSDEEWAAVCEADTCPPGAKSALARTKRNRSMKAQP